MKYFIRIICMSALMVSVTAAGAAGLDPIEQLGKNMYQDKDFSFNGTQSCLSCHHRSSGYADPDNSRDPYNSVVSTGADGVSKGDRNAPTAAYAGFSPALQWSASVDGYVGGLFWDGRATGHVLGDPLAEQAQGPPLNPAEMNMPDAASVVAVVREANYVNLFLQVFGAGSLDDVASAYDNIARAIAAFERSTQVQKFSSRFDRGLLTDEERAGWALFQSHCAKCHATQPQAAGVPPLFTNFQYVNIGVPANPILAGNPVDLGLGGFLEQDWLSDTPVFGDENFAAQNGKFKVPTLRNVALTAPYGHNGFFPTLRDVIDFHNSRDVAVWPLPEVTDNLNSRDVGDMGLDDRQIDSLSAFLMSLSDARPMRP